MAPHDFISDMVVARLNPNEDLLASGPFEQSYEFVGHEVRAQQTGISDFDPLTIDFTKLLPPAFVETKDIIYHENFPYIKFIHNRLNLLDTRFSAPVSRVVSAISIGIRDRLITAIGTGKRASPTK